MYIPYKNKQTNPSAPQAVDTVDCHDVQADVLATDVSENTKITGLKQLKTETKVPTKAINALNEQLGNAQASASDALQAVTGVTQRVTTVENRVTRLENNGAALGSTSGTVDGDIARQLMKEVKSWETFTSANGVEMDTPLVLEVSKDAKLAHYLPAAVSNVKFFNDDPESRVSIYWNAEHLDGEIGTHLLTARYKHGYFGTAPTCTVTITEEEMINYPQANCVYGMIPANQGGDYGGPKTWVRVDQNFNTVTFNAANHGTWANMRTVTENGDTFVEIPTTWVKTETLTDGPYAGKQCWWIADGYVDGFHVHPAFMTTDGKPGNLRVGAYMTSKNTNNLPVSVAKGTAKTDYWTSILYEELQPTAALRNVNGVTGYRAYNFYDACLINLLILTEVGHVKTYNTTVNGMNFTGNSRLVFHGIYDPLSICYSSMSAYVYMMIDGFQTIQTVYHILAPDGSGVMVDTGVQREPLSTMCVHTCKTGVVAGVDLGDLFIVDTYSASGTSTAANCIFTRGSLGGNNILLKSGISNFMEFTAAPNVIDTNGGMICPGPKTSWRLCQVVPVAW